MDFGWLAGFFQWVGQFILAIWPWKIIRAYEIGIRFCLGHDPVVLTPGICRAIPLLDQVGKICPFPQWLDCPDQPVTTVDGETVLISGSIYYEIVDYYRYWMKVQDTDRSLVTMIMARQALKISWMEYNDVTIDAIHKAVTPIVRRQATQWGVKILEYAVNILAKTGDGVNWHAGNISLDQALST